MRIPMSLAGLVAGSMFLTTAVAQGDECTNPLVVIDGLNGPFSNAGSTTSAPAWPCGAGGNDVWFLYVATCTGTLTLDTCSATRTYDTTIEVFDGVAQPCGNMTGGICNDDFCGLGSTVSIGVTAGNPYYVRVGGFGSATGSFDLNIVCSGGGGGVPNEECTTAIPVNLGPNGPFSNVGASTSAPGWPCGAGAEDVWFSYAATCSGPHTFDTCTNTTYDSTLEVFDGTCAALVSLGCNDDFCGLQSTLQVTLTAGSTYFIRVGGFGGANGSFDLNVTVGTGAGTIGLANSSTCAGGLTISVTGNPNIGGAVTTALGGITGVSFFTWDVNAPNTAPGNCSPCPLLLGAFGWNFGTGNTLNIPCDASYIGVNVFTQGVEIFGAGGCVLPPALTLSDVYQIVIG
ncbi:MAG: hypothetical protein IPK26_03325 [Planctomycetes bacterium]|nr:hypothetical protein [Planctomycetota bacterium]